MIAQYFIIYPSTVPGLFEACVIECKTIDADCFNPWRYVSDWVRGDAEEIGQLLGGN